MRYLVAALFVFASLTPVFAQATYNNPETGTRVLGTYFAADVDTVSLKNGNLHVNIPVFSVPGREIPLRLSMDYNSMAYQRRDIWVSGVHTYYWDYHAWRKDTGVAGKLSASAIRGNWTHGCPGSPFIDDQTAECIDWNLTFVWTSNDGTQRTFTGTKTLYCIYNEETDSYPCAESPGGTIYDNITSDINDSEFIQLKTGNHFSQPNNPTQPAIIYFKDGSSFDVSYRTMRTTNGNRLSAASNTQTVTLYGDPLTDFMPVSDTVGRTITFSKTSTTDTTTLTDSNGQSKAYIVTWEVIQADGPLSMTDKSITIVRNIQLPSGKSYHFDYDSRGYLEKLTFPSGAYTKYEYYTSTDLPQIDSMYKWVKSRRVSANGTTAGEKTWGYAYTFNSNNTIASATVTDPTGAYRTQNFSGALAGTTTDYASTGTVMRTTERSWVTGSNPAVSVLKTTLNGVARETHLTYDSKNNLTLQEDYDWNPTSQGTGVKLKSTARTYESSSYYIDRHMFSQLLSETVSNPDNSTAAKAEFAYDQYSLTSRTGTIPGWVDPGTTYRGNLTTIKRYRNADNYIAEHIHYDVLGNPVEKDDPLNHATTIDFTDNFCTLTSGSCTNTSGHNSFAYPTRITNALSQYTTTRYDFNTGLPTVGIDLRGFETKTIYDKMNRVKSITESNLKATTYDYNDDTRVTTKEVTVDSTHKGHVETCFDGFYRVIRTRTDDAEGTIAVDADYDSLGRANRISNPYRVSGDYACTADTVVPPAWTHTKYDAIGRVVCTSVSSSGTSPCESNVVDAKVLYAYSANTTTTTNEAGNNRRYTYDALGRMTKVEEPNPTLSTPLVTTYIYETIGALKQTNQSGQTRTLTHDWLGRETQEVLPESGTTTFSYNDDGKMKSATDARGIVTCYEYDALGRSKKRFYRSSTQCQWSDSDYGGPPVTFDYDQNGYTGLRTSMVDSLGTVYYDYDNFDNLHSESTGMGRLTREQRQFDSTKAGVSGTFNTWYSYNLKGDLNQMKYPSGRVVDLSYATDGGCCNSRLASVVDGTTNITLANSMSFDAAGALTARTLNPNGTVPVAQTFAFNHRMQPTQVRATEGSTTLLDFSYDYGTANNVGQLLSRTDAVQPEHSVRYTYDSIYQLSGVYSTATSGIDWSIAWEFDAWSNRLRQTPQGHVYSNNIIGTQTLGYTNNRMDGQTYDAAGNVTNDGSHNYSFNGKNQITSMDGGTATYMYDGEGRRVKKTVSSVSTFYFYGPGGIISEFSTSSGASGASSSDRTAYQTSDRQGTAVLLIASNGLVLENNRTLPYGELWCPPATASNTTKKFTTYERDSESNLDYAMNRYTANTYGRFQSTDKGGVFPYVPSSLNRYTYALNNPVNNTDPDGNLMHCDYAYLRNQQGIAIACIPPPMPPLPDGPTSSNCWDLAPGGCPDPGTEGGGGEEGPINVCDRNDDTYKMVTDFRIAHQWAADNLAGITGLSSDFILAWAARESSYGKWENARFNNNFLGLKPGVDLHGNIVNPTGNWLNAVDCSGLPGYHHIDNVCFSDPNPNTDYFSMSVISALYSQNGRYLNAALSAGSGASVYDIATAVGKAGFNGGDYGADIQGANKAIQDRKNCPQ